MTVVSQIRAYRNIPTIRYTGRIHEKLSINKEKVINTDNVTVVHTGYSQAAHNETGKAERNVGLLREELVRTPNDAHLKAYLANALSISKDEKNQDEAEKLFDEVIKSKEHINAVHKMKAYMFFINKYINKAETLQHCEEMCRAALEEFPKNLDYMYFLAATRIKKEEYQNAWELLKECETRLLRADDLDGSVIITADPTIVFSQMILAAKGLGDIENVLLYSTHILSIDKTKLSVLGPCIATLLYYGVSETETIELLSNIYDFNDRDDLNLVAQAAKACGATGFAERITND
jgi:tetratricopeptide (TPR) repeat protein